MDMINSGLYIENDSLYDYACATARLLRCEGEGSERKSARLLRLRLEDIRRSHDAIQRRYGDLASPPAACEWLLDNWYMVQREYVYAFNALERARHPRYCSQGLLIVQLCKSLLESGLGQVTEERCRIFLDGFQSVCVLRREELDLFPAAIRAAIITAIANVCEKLEFSADTQQQARELEALFGSLRLFSVLDTEKLINAADVTNAILSADPGGDYPQMDSGTKLDYLRRVEKLSRREGLEEHIYARRLIKKAKAENRHVGFYLFSPVPAFLPGLYIGANVLISLFFSLLIAFLLDSAWAAVLLVLPVWELVKSLMDYILLHSLKPRRLPRMDTSKGLPSGGRTICVISVLLTDKDSAQKAARKLSELREACKREGKGLSFGLLADLPAAQSDTTPQDEAIISAAENEINALNARYGGGFYLFCRPRCFDGEQWTGYERKRGAILELARLLCDLSCKLRITGDKDALSGTNYILTLDSDTRIYPGSVAQLIGAMLHPLCRPYVDEKKGVVTRGHAIIHPRMDTELASANATDFALIFAGAGGSDPYGGLCGELYMDAFDNGGFAGKGIIDARALIKCTAERFPEAHVLSHDALEGACLRGAFMGDAEFSDGFPAHPLAYYKRMHRWVRGDWQNLPWVFERDFAPIDRFRLFDSLRRSLLPPMTLIAILAGFFLPVGGLAVSAWAALLALLSRLFLSLAEGGLRRRERVRLRRYTRLLTGVGGAIVHTFIRLWLLPYEAWVCLSAIITSLWRMLVSHKRLLQWQTAAQSEKSAHGLSACLRAMWFPMLLGLGLLFFSPAIIGRSAGLMWLLSPLMAAALALPAHRETELSCEDREYIVNAAKSSFRYLLEFSTALDNYLPPDNFQEQPPVGVAHRTSPTNIGFAMVSAVAACDMGICTSREACEYIGRIVTSLERMPRCLGHYYNWYDTKNLQPLSPAFISTVDSGNLYAGLLTCHRALLEWGRDELARRVLGIMEPMDFAPLFDSERRLFYICYDSTKQQGAGGWYDLMASEAMLTSYLAIAKGDVPISHWRRLSRAQLQKDGFRGLASWTGTMFEYLMPELFLPFYRGSLLQESGRFCVYVQKRRVFAGKPWGISESAFYSLDAALNYRYKANGCSALALKRGQDADMVVSPYSSFLALSIDPHGAAKNLRRLARFGALGRFGYIEALDFTPSRCRNDSGEKVRCYMAHHVGMSIIAAANAVCQGSIRRRFMGDSAMSAHSLLLQEKLPGHGLVIRRDMTQVPEKPQRSMDSFWQLRGGMEDIDLRCCLLSNGAYNILSTSQGGTSAGFGDICVYGRQSREPEGIELHLLEAGESRRLLPHENPQLWELAEDRCRWSVKQDGLSCTMSLAVAAGEWGELRTIELRSAADMEPSLCLSFRPILAAMSDYTNHPAFWRLGIRAELADNALLLQRLRRGKASEIWLCIACDSPAEFSPQQGQEGPWLSDPYVSVMLKPRLKAGLTCSVRFSLCLGTSRQESLEGAKRILGAQDSGSMVGAAAARLGMNAREIGAAMELLPQILTPPTQAAARRELWQYGISGDLPLICCDGRAVECLPLLRRFCLLKSCGASCELVYLSDEQGEYQRPLHRRISEALAAVGLEALLGCRGGVHFATLSAQEIIASRACLMIGRAAKPQKPLLLPNLGRERAPASLPLHGWNGSSFEYYVNRSLPARAWQHILSNGHFGCIVSDSGLGFMWYENAREMRINPPAEHIRQLQGSEALWVELFGRPISLFAANDGLPCRVSYAPGYARWEKELEGRRLETTAFIPSGIDARVYIIKGGAGLSLRWALKPVLGAADPSSLKCSFSQGLFRAENPESYLPGIQLVAGASLPCICKTDFEPPAMLMSLTAEDVTVLACGCCPGEELLELCRCGVAMTALEGVKKRWSGLLSRLDTSTGVSALDHYMNHWAAYQSIACRLEGRSSLYQSGGALGFRDQLQDGVNLLLLSPRYARERILDCCRHQYVEGDVMHWWHAHPQGDKGIRSRCSDDLLWLCWALCRYVQATGDEAICEQELNYIDSPPLSSYEDDRYETPQVSQASASVLFHARAALDCCINRGFGPNGLPFIGSGDWNDGLDAVDGESVWLGWFFSCCARDFALLLERLGKPQAKRYLDYAAQVGKAADRAFNGSWYLRGYLPDGSALGGEQRIDSLPQSWAAMNEFASVGKVQRAMDEALRRLVDKDNSLVLLFDPPFSAQEPYPGYIMSYGEGFRENGGQYTHGAIWLAMACFKLNRADEGWDILSRLLPENHDLRRYQAEPFVLSADLYSAPGHQGEAGWSWYTGSAAWYFRVVAEYMLGLQLENGLLYLRPNLPAALPEYSARWTDSQGREHRIQVRPEGISVDGESYSGQGIGGEK